MVQCLPVSSISTFPSPVPERFCVPLRICKPPSGALSSCQRSFSCKKEIEELARPQEQLLEMNGWLGPDAWVGGGDAERPTETSIKGSSGGHGQEDGKEGQG